MVLCIETNELFQFHRHFPSHSIISNPICSPELSQSIRPTSHLLMSDKFPEIDNDMLMIEWVSEGINLARLEWGVKVDPLAELNAT